MIIKENKFKVVKWGFNATTNDFPKSYVFEWKDKSGGHSHTHMHTHIHSSICKACMKVYENIVLISITSFQVWDRITLCNFYQFIFIL